MKLLVQADDYGMTIGVTEGIVASARDGVLTQTGLFTNMPSTEYAVRRYKEEIPHVLLGQDLNLSTGSPVTDPKLIPSLVQENGAFLTSKMHRIRQTEDPNHISYEEAFLEYDNQVKRFIELVGDIPGYIGGHAFMNETTDKALHDIIAKYGARDAMALVPMADDRIIRVSGWSNPKQLPDKTYDYSVMTQLEQDPLTMFIEHHFREFEEHADDPDAIAMIHTHAGFWDRDLYKLSSFNAVRPMEAGFLCSEELKNFIKEHNIELVNYSFFD